MPGFWPTRLRDGWEYCFHLAKSKEPYINQDAVHIPAGEWMTSRLAKLGQNDLTRHNSVNKSGFGRDLSKWVGKKTVLPSNVISAALVGKNKGHPAVFPLDIPDFFIKLLCPEDGFVCDPFGGSGTTGIVAAQLFRRCLLIDNNPDYCKTAIARLKKEGVIAIEGIGGVTSNKNGKHISTIPEDAAEQISFFEKPPVYKVNGHKSIRRIKK
jgi:site-specific DNA-methyltransferase (adenine-specific)